MWTTIRGHSWVTTWKTNGTSAGDHGDGSHGFHGHGSRVVCVARGSKGDCGDPGAQETWIQEDIGGDGTHPPDDNHVEAPETEVYRVIETMTVSENGNRDRHHVEGDEDCGPENALGGPGARDVGQA